MAEEAKANSLVEAINSIGESFEKFKVVNDQKLDEERKGNETRAKELTAVLDKISADLTQSVKDKAILEKRLAALQERTEIVEALNDRPRATVQDKIKGEHKDLCLRWIRSKGEDFEAVNEYKKLIEKAREVKDVTIGTTTAGGFALPEEISRTVDKLLLKTSPILQFVKNVQVGTQDYKELISVNSATYAWSAETGTRSATTTPVLREHAPTWGELYAYPQASNWSLEDIFFSVEGWLVESIAEGHAVGLSVALWNGNGSAKPTGFINTAPATNDDYASPERNQYSFEYIPISAPSSPFTSTGLTADTVISLVYQLNPRYRGNARFAANTVTQGHLRKLKDSNGQYLWQPSLQAGQPDRLLGYELFTWEEMGNPTTSAAFPLAFGDFNKAYTLATRTGMQIIRDQVTTPGYTKFYVSRRFGGITTNNNAVKFAKVSIS
jgi:HK97 family phage major capsid protein